MTTRAASRRARVVCIAAAALAATLLALASTTAAKANGPAITGAGSTWAAIALDQWEVDAARMGLSINYQAVGSTAGRQFYIIGQVDFAASEIPFLPSEVAQLKGEHRSYQYLPDVAGGTAIMYNLKDAAGHQVNNLRLSAKTIAGIFTGKITNWDDPEIKADNPGLRLPSEHLTPVIRADGAGTSAKLADYLHYEAPAVWNPFAAANHVTYPVQFWPNFPGAVAVQRSDGVANYISNPSVGSGSIGYVEAGFVYEHSFTPAYLRNASGDYTAPSSENDATALKHALINPNLTENLIPVYNAPEPTAYALASYSYLITQTTGFDPAKGAVLGKWIIYIACAGQKEAAPLGYSPLPPNLVKADFEAVRRIPGAPKPPPLTPQGCPNPTITGAGYGGSPQSGSGGTSGGTSTTTAPTTTAPTTTKHHHKHHKQTTSKPTTTTTTTPADPTSSQTVTPLSATARRAAYAAAVKEMANVSPASTYPQWWVVLVALAILVAPLVGLHRMSPRPRSGPDA
jgi:phosphate transport system substrate-binding protein